MIINIPEKVGGHQKQEAVWICPARFIDVMAGRRGGKDWISARKFIKRIYNDLKKGRGYHSPSIKLEIPRLHYWCVAPSYKLNAVQKREIFKFIPETAIQDWVASRSKLWIYPEILIEFKSAENPEKLVSEGLNGIYITETARLKASVWNDNLRPTLSDKQGWGIFTTTPLGRNWYIDDIRALSDPASETKHPDWEGFYWKTSENTKCPGLIEEVEKAKATMPERYFRRNYEASPDAYHGQVFEEFDIDKHVVDFDVDLDRYKYVVAGQDWGFTHNGVLCVVGITPDDDVDVIELVSAPNINVVSTDPDQRTWRNIDLQLQDKYGIEWIFGGVDQPENITILRREGVDGRCVNIRGAKNAVRPSIDFLSTLMRANGGGRPKFRIRKCAATKPLVSGIINYRWDDKPGKEQPIKENDDEVDALRYAVYSAYVLKYIGIDFMGTNHDEGEEVEE